MRLREDMSMNKGEKQAGCLFGNQKKEQTVISRGLLSGAAGKKQAGEAFSVRMASGAAGMKKRHPAGGFPEA